MATQIKSSFTIIIDGQPGGYSIRATGPNDIQVDSQELDLSMVAQHEQTLHLLATKPNRVTLEEKYMTNIIAATNDG